MEGAKDVVRRILGEEETERLKRLLGRRPSPVHERAPVTVVDSVSGTDTDPLQLAMVRSVSAEQLRSEQPIEHVLPPGSESYESIRREIIGRYYDVVNDPS